LLLSLLLHLDLISQWITHILYYSVSQASLVLVRVQPILVIILFVIHILSIGIIVVTIAILLLQLLLLIIKLLVHVSLILFFLVVEVHVMDLTISHDQPYITVCDIARVVAQS
jgi:hypothetical protein